MSALNLYSRRRLSVSLALVFFVGLISIAGAQRRSQHKLRATALLELTTDSKGVHTARVIPITILDQGTFHDASIYKAAPQPMALESGVVYEAEKTGQPVGYVTVSTAAKDRIWTALGKWQSVNDRPKPRPSATPAQNVDDRPRLRRSGGGDAGPQSTPGASPSSSPTTSPSSGSDDRPVLRRPASDTQAQASPSPSPSSTSGGRPPQPANTGQSGDPGSDDRPVLRRPAADTQAQASPSPSPAPGATPAVTPETSSASEDPNRPLLRHGKPTATPAAENVAKPVPSLNPSAGTAGKSPGSGATPAGTQVYVAVSDAEAGDTRSFQFAWKTGEEAPIAAKLRHEAAQRLAQEPGVHASAAAIERELKNVVVRSFDLDLTNDAVMVLDGELPPITATSAKPVTKRKAGSKAALAEGSTSSPASPVTRYITLIARVDIDGNPQVLAANMTDSSRLDVAPRLELVDAVDVDGDGIGELLFRQYGFDNQGFVIYAVRHGAVAKLFEGASQALR